MQPIAEVLYQVFPVHSSFSRFELATRLYCVVILIVCLLKACVKHCDDVDLVLVEAPHVGVLPGEGGDHGDLVQTHQASTQHRLHVTRLPRHGDLSHKLSRVN